MGIFEIIMSSIGGVLVSGGLLYAGNRYTANKTTEVSAALAQVEQRKVTVLEFTEFTKRYDEDMKQMRDELTDSKQHLSDTRTTLRLAIGVIASMRNTLQRNNLAPDPLPPQVDYYYTMWDTQGFSRGS